MKLLNEKQKQLHKAIDNNEYLQVVMDRRDGLTTGLLLYAINKLLTEKSYHVLYLTKYRGIVSCIMTMFMANLPDNVLVSNPENNSISVGSPEDYKTFQVLPVTDHLSEKLKGCGFDLVIADVDLTQFGVELEGFRIKKLVVADTVNPAHFLNLATPYKEPIND